MIPSLSRSHILIVPLLILTFILFEEFAAYELRQHVASPWLRTFAIMALYGPGIALFTTITSPRLKSLLVNVRSRSRRSGGGFGVVVFLTLVYGLLYWAYFILETRGPSGLFPG